MTDNTFELVFTNWKQRAVSLNLKLTPFVNVEVDINADDWEEKLAQRPHPADASGLRLQITALFNEIINQFESYSSNERQQIIDLMYKNDALMYAAVIDGDRNTPDGFRKYMILFAIEDQGKDTRDAILALTHAHREAKQQGIDVDTVVKEMVAIASTHDKFGWGSTRDLFLKYL